MNLPFPFRHRPAGAPGVALIVTLMMMAVLTLMVVGLAGVMRNEQAAARNLTYQMLAEQLAQVGAQEAMQKVMVNSPTNSANAVLASGPGWLSSGTNLTALFQTNRTQGAANLEAIGTNSLVLSLMPGATANIPAGWSNIVSPVATTNALIGRYSWWVDDEGAKLNLNAVGVSSNSRALMPAGRNFAPLSGDFIFVNPFSGATNSTDAQMGSQIAVRSNFFPTTESLKDTNITRITNPGVSGTVYGRTKGHVTAFSQSADMTPWGTPKFNLNDLTNTNVYPTPQAAVTAVKACLMTNAWENVFGVGMSLGRKYGGGQITSINTNNHGDLVMEQIAKNILGGMGRPFLNTNFGGGGRRDPILGPNNPNRHRNGLPREIASHYVGPYIEEVRVRVDGSVGGGSAITGRLGILVRIVNPYSLSFSNYTLVVQPRKFRFQAVPVPGQQGATSSDIQNPTSGDPLNGFTGPRDYESTPGGNTGWYIGPEWYDAVDPWPTNTANIFKTNISLIGPQSRVDIPFQQTISYTLGGNRRAESLRAAYVILDSVKICRGINNFTDVIDWVSLDDFSQPGNYENSRQGNLSDIGQLNLTVFNATSLPDIGNSDLFGALGGNVAGLRRIDPQARFPVSFWSTNTNERGYFLRNGGWSNTVQAWTRTLTAAQTFTNRAISYLAPDPAPGVLDLTNHPHFTPGFYVTNGISSIGQLGAIHTGIPWRTLRFQPQPREERTAANNATNSPPDWILLDLFTVTNPFLTNRPMLNLNSFTLGLAGAGLGPVSVAQGGSSNPPIRTWAVLGALGVWMTNRYDTNLLISSGIPLSATNNLPAYRASLVGLVTNLQAAFTNLAGLTNWSSNSAWPSHRSGFTGTKLPTYGLGLRGEFLELRGMAEDTNNVLGEDAIEGRLRPYLDLLSTRSDTFSVWSVGQALAVSGNATNVMAEIRKQTVFRRVPRFQTGQVTGYDLEVVYTRNHMLE